MRRYLFARLLRTIPVAFGVVTVVFLLIHLLTGDPVEIMPGESAAPTDGHPHAEERGEPRNNASSAPSPQNRLNFFLDILEGERFLDERGARIELPVVNDGAVRIP